MNIPAKLDTEITGFTWARQGQKNVESLTAKRRVSPRQEEYFWIVKTETQPVVAPNTDIAILRRGEVAVTALTYDRSVEINKPSVVFDEPEAGGDETLASLDG